MGQCEGCERHIDEAELCQPVLCTTCLDNLASYDNCKAERDFLVKAAQAASADLSNLNLEDNSDMALKTGRANGYLLTALTYCGLQDEIRKGKP